MTWHPIATAPKDRTRVLLCEGMSRLVTVASWYITPRGRRREWMAIDGCRIYEPTHWMPLPSPPDDTP